MKIVSFYAHYVCQKWIDLRQTMITDPSSNTFLQRKCFVFVIFVWNNPGGPRVAAATWPCAYLLTLKTLNFTVNIIK